MPVNIVLTTLNESGLAAIRTNPKKINANKAALEAMGVKAPGQYITLKQYDFVNIFEANNEETILKAAVNLSGKGVAHTETLAALTADSFTKIAGKKL